MRCRLGALRTSLPSAPFFAALALFLSAAPVPTALAQTYDTVIANGRVLDPESGLDAVRNVGVIEGRIAALTEKPLAGRRVIDASGLIVAPGFIDLHSHAQDPLSNLYQAHDGVTTSLELELGVYPVAKWYDELAGKMLLNYGATVSHTVAHAVPLVGLELLEKSTDPYGAGLIDRDTVQKVSAATLTPEQNQQMATALQRGIDQGALGIGMGIQYLPGVDRVEIYRGFEVAARNKVTVFVHQRSAGLLPPDSIDSLQELMADAVASGASVHVCHVGSSGMKQARMMIEMIDAAHSRGLDITTEVYPTLQAWRSMALRF